MTTGLGPWKLAGQEYGVGKLEGLMSGVVDVWGKTARREVTGT